MFDELFNMIQQSGQQAVVNNNQVPNEHNEDVLREAHTAVVNGLGNMQAPDQVNGLVNSVQSGSAQSNPAVQQISNNFMGSIMQKFGIDAGTASSIAAAIIPIVISKVVAGKSAQGGAGGFDLGGLLGGLTGGTSSGSTQAGGLGGKISSIGSKFGLDKDRDGDVDLNDLTKMFK
ncbi:hypothetical protein [Dyadobacter crusticola]|uniref:hypothetical protein n=1 Tax=Dyadobacter crusticola TaxID=292407 RepID=UPI0004E0FCD5|nr:hypothetical protein [Dyadobacter crusticola]